MTLIVTTTTTNNLTLAEVFIFKTVNVLLLNEFYFV